MNEAAPSQGVSGLKRAGYRSWCLPSAHDQVAWEENNMPRII